MLVNVWFYVNSCFVSVYTKYEVSKTICLPSSDQYHLHIITTVVPLQSLQARVRKQTLMAATSHWHIIMYMMRARTLQMRRTQNTRLRKFGGSMLFSVDVVYDLHLAQVLFGCLGF